MITLDPPAVGVPTQQLLSVLQARQGQRRQQQPAQRLDLGRRVDFLGQQSLHGQGRQVLPPWVRARRLQGERAVTHRQGGRPPRLAILAWHRNREGALHGAVPHRHAQQRLATGQATTQLGAEQQVLAGPTWLGQEVVEVRLAVADGNDRARAWQGSQAGLLGVEPTL